MKLTTKQLKHLIKEEISQLTEVNELTQMWQNDTKVLFVLKGLIEELDKLTDGGIVDNWEGVHVILKQIGKVASDLTYIKK